MRIRKRFPPSDPHYLNHSSTVAVQQHPIRQTPPPDHPAPIRTQNPNPGWALSGCDPCQRKMEQKELEEVKDERIITASNDSKKDGISSAHQDSLISQPFSSFDHQGRWCGGEREVPLKKRRGGFEKYVAGKETMKPKMKSKTNKKCVQENDNDDNATAKNNIKNNNEEYEDSNNNNNNGGKRSKRGSEIVEGSRCSRVNGRGWRCCQQTLVGYSLCEHHLGKGRLRSVNNTLRNRSRMGEATSKSNKADNNEELSAETSWDSSKEKPLLMLLENVDDDDDDEDNERMKPSMMSSSSSNKKRMKIGMVKARSISSLLGLTDNLVATKVSENEG